jgi:transcription termination factor Rho
MVRAGWAWSPWSPWREELLLPAAELAADRGLRRALHTQDAQAALEVLLDRIRQTPDNATFLRRIHGTVPAA